MGDIRWYKRDPDAALVGMADLTLEECGAYNLILDLIYSREGNLKDDDRQISGWLRCHIRVWKRIRRRLMELGKLYVHAGCIHNRRADRELNAAQHRVLSAANAGRVSWATRKEKINIINDTRVRSVQRPFELPTPRKKERKNTEYVEGESKEDANRASKGIGEATDALRETIERKGWRK
jgi:uncharacterized protein YdaU (DUF1376 family)